MYFRTISGRSVWRYRNLFINIRNQCNRVGSHGNIAFKWRAVTVLAFGTGQACIWLVCTSQHCFLALVKDAFYWLLMYLALVGTGMEMSIKNLAWPEIDYLIQRLQDTKSLEKHTFLRMAANITRGDPTVRKEHCSPFDLGVLFKDIEDFSDQRKYEVITNVWKPDEGSRLSYINKKL